MVEAPREAAPFPVIVVASWYPGVDDPARGRFVADQAEALHATGRASPVVVSFDGARVHGDQLERVRAEGVVERHRARALRGDAPAFNRAAWSLSASIPTARIPILVGLGRMTPPGSDADLRREALVELADVVDVPAHARGVVHAHTAYPDGFAAAALADRLGWPLVITEHASFVARHLRQADERRRYLEAVEAASRFLAVSEVLATELAAAIPALEGKLEVMPNAIPLDEYVATGLEGRHRDALLFVGYRKPTKGIEVLIRAFAEVHAARPSATLRLIGRSPTDAVEDRWRRLADDLGVADEVRLEGTADRAGVAEAMRTADVLVHASPRETFGMTTLEALASGTPVVATRSGGISHLLEDERLGELVPPEDPHALASAILRTLERRADFDPVVLREAVTPYSATVVGARLVELYGTLWDGREGPSRAARSGGISLTGTAGVVPRHLIVVAHDTATVAGLLALMPAELRRRLTLVTADARNGALPAGIGTVVDAGAEGDRTSAGWRQALVERVQRSRLPFARRLLRGWVARHGARRHAAIVAAMRASLRAAPEVAAATRSGPCEVVCLDAVDHEAASPLISDGRLVPVPGGVLWLADAWWSAEPATT